MEKKSKLVQPKSETNTKKPDVFQPLTAPASFLEAKFFVWRNNAKPFRYFPFLEAQLFTDFLNYVPSYNLVNFSMMQMNGPHYLGMKEAMKYVYIIKYIQQYCDFIELESIIHNVALVYNVDKEMLRREVLTVKGLIKPPPGNIPIEQYLKNLSEADLQLPNVQTDTNITTNLVVPAGQEKPAAPSKRGRKKKEQNGEAPKPKVKETSDSADPGQVKKKGRPKKIKEDNIAISKLEEALKRQADGEDVLKKKIKDNNSVGKEVSVEKPVEEKNPNEGEKKEEKKEKKKRQKKEKVTIKEIEASNGNLAPVLGPIAPNLMVEKITGMEKPEESKKIEESIVVEKKKRQKKEKVPKKEKTEAINGGTVNLTVMDFVDINLLVGKEINVGLINEDKQKNGIVVEEKKKRKKKEKVPKNEIQASNTSNVNIAALLDTMGSNMEKAINIEKMGEKPKMDQSGPVKEKKKRPKKEKVPKNKEIETFNGVSTTTDQANNSILPQKRVINEKPKEADTNGLAEKVNEKGKAEENKKPDEGLPVKEKKKRPKKEKVTKNKEIETVSGVSTTTDQANNSILPQKEVINEKPKEEKILENLPVVKEEKKHKKEKEKEKNKKEMEIESDDLAAMDSSDSEGTENSKGKSNKEKKLKEPQQYMDLYINNTIDDDDGEGFSFFFVNQNVYNKTKQYFEKKPRPEQICSCIGGCNDPTVCPCAKMNFENCGKSACYVYDNKHGKKKLLNNLIRKDMHIYECSSQCACSKSLCFNSCVGDETNKIDVKDFIVERYNKVYAGQDPSLKGFSAVMWGLKARTLVPANTYVVEYCGEIITKKEGDRRGEKYDSVNCNYLFDLNKHAEIEKIDEATNTMTLNIDGICETRSLSKLKDITENFPLVIDAFFYGNHSRFVNHSCSPNMVAIAVHIENRNILLPRIIFFALRDIQPGEELTIDYNCAPLKDLKNTEKLTCLCGAPNCRGFVYEAAQEE